MNRISALILPFILIVYIMPAEAQDCLPPHIRYNQVQQLSSHNSFTPHRLKPDIRVQADSGIRSFELDIHARAFGRHAYPSHVWKVYHLTHRKSREIYGHTLNDFLFKFNQWHQQHPNHEVITIWLQLRGGWDSGHKPEALDTVLLKALPPGCVYTPDDLLAGSTQAANLQEAVAAGWPELSNLSGKFMIVLTGNVKAWEEYLAGKKHSCFVAPQNKDSVMIRSLKNTVFFNFSSGNIPKASFASGLGFVSRVYAIPKLFTGGSIEKSVTYSMAVSGKVQHIVTDHVTQKLFFPRLKDPCGNVFRFIH
ncbi:MAG: Ca2+-dependent phosphoinositide-specific phospholipase C [Bacteroidia bacterium]